MTDATFSKPQQPPARGRRWIGIAAAVALVGAMAYSTAVVRIGSDRDVQVQTFSPASFGAEQFPNEARSTGLGLGYGLGASAKIFGPALLGSLFGAKVTPEIIPAAFLFFAVLLVIGGITYRFAEETKGKSLDKI